MTRIRRELLAGFVGTGSLLLSGCSGIGGGTNKNRSIVIRQIHIINTKRTGQNVDIVLISGDNTPYWEEHELEPKSGDVAGDTVVDGTWVLKNDPKKILVKASSKGQNNTEKNIIYCTEITDSDKECIEIKATIKPGEIPISISSTENC